MKRYKVLKEFVEPNGVIVSPPMYIHREGSTMIEGLLKNGFIEEIPEQSKTVWDLKEGDSYYWLTEYDGVGGAYTMREDQLGYMRQHRKVGNCFLTLKDAEKELARRKAKVILERDTKGFKPDWYDYDENRYYVYYALFCGNRKQGSLGKLQIENAKWSIPTDLYFATKEDAKASIKAHEQEWLCYLNIEDE